MRVAIVGAGAIGGWMAASLADAGWCVSVLARGPTLNILRTDGLRLCSDGGERTYRLTVSESGAELGVQDYVILAVKGYDLPTVVPKIAPMLQPDTVIVTAMNGLPWWFTNGIEGLESREPLTSIDPAGEIAEALGSHRILGCVIHASAQRRSPGVVDLVKADRLTFGAPDGGSSPEVEQLAAGFAASGVDARVSTDIRREIWMKLWGNVTMNPLSVLTGATTARMLDDPDVAGLCLSMMQEMARVGEKIGLSLPISARERMTVTRRLGDFKTSMLQDYEAGRRLEIAPLLGAVVELAERLDEPVPFMRAALGLVRLRAASSGLCGRPA